MKYYLETNALRALGSTVGHNANLLANSYTSLFSIFELMKGIRIKEDSPKRINILSSLVNTELNIVDLMPNEMLKSAFINIIPVDHSVAITEKLISLVKDPNNSTPGLYDEIVSGYERSKNHFQSKINESYVKPKPEPEKITLDMSTLFDDATIDIPQSIRDLPEGHHPSRVAMEMQKRDHVPSIYRTIFKESDLDDQRILELYNNRLDLFMFSNYMYQLKKECLRESASKNDFFDILHVIYLFDYDKVIVSNDKIFDYILPDINHISVEDYKKLT